MSKTSWKLWRFYSDLGSGLVQILYTVYKIAFDFDDEETVFIICFVELEIYLAILFKNFYRYPRPFWVFADIKVQECSSSFGDPSGHSFCAGFFITYIYFTWIFPKYYKIDSTIKNKLILISSFVILLAA